MSSARNVVIPVSDIIFEKEGKILLLRRFQTGYADGLYAFPAGHIHKGESPKNAALREAREETGLLLTSEDLKFVHIMHRLISNSDQSEFDYLDYFFLCQKWDGEPEIAEPHKCDDMAWFPIYELPRHTIPYVREVVRYVFEEKTYYSDFTEPSYPYQI